jgi:uncharacterized damage-inducible protein DinB
MVSDLGDARRQRPSYLLGERDMLEAWLEFHRTTLLLKCEGLDDEARKRRPVVTSKLSLHGLVRHMAEVERNWFWRVLLRQADAPRIFRPTADWDGDWDTDMEPLGQAGWVADLASWQAECEQSRLAAASRDLDDTGLDNGEPVSLRWIYVHMIEEYARHNGHGDLVREMVDGAVGW